GMVEREFRQQHRFVRAKTQWEIAKFSALTLERPELEMRRASATGGEKIPAARSSTDRGGNDHAGKAGRGGHDVLHQTQRGIERPRPGVGAMIADEQLFTSVAGTQPREDREQSRAPVSAALEAAVDHEAKQLPVTGLLIDPVQDIADHLRAGEN